MAMAQGESSSRLRREIRLRPPQNAAGAMLGSVQLMPNTIWKHAIAYDLECLDDFETSVLVVEDLISLSSSINFTTTKKWHLCSSAIGSPADCFEAKTIKQIASL